MACEDFLPQMEEAANQIDSLEAEKAQIDQQILAQTGILTGSWMLYMQCLENQQPMAQVSLAGRKEIPSYSDIRVELKKAIARRKLRLKRKKK